MSGLQPGSPVPGLDGVWPDLELGDPPGQVVRTADNQWLLGLGGTADELLAWPRWRGSDAVHRPAPPSVTDPGIVAAAGHAGPGFLARVELDACGAWVTMACTQDLRPLVVRRAGWVDERGDAVVKRHRPWPEDRVGLGPGDAVVVVRHAASDPEPGGDDDLDPVAERLLDHLGTGARALLDAIPAPPQVVAALAVPTAVAGVGPGWVAEATGIPEAELVLPGYPLGDREPERWRQPPSAPRRAVFRLHRDLTRLKDLRGVLGRLVSSWRLEGHVDAEILTLLTTELATNALVHTDTAATATVTYLGPLVRVEVHDGSPRLPERREAGAYDIGGRGIALVEELAAEWGSRVTPTGKRTWFDLPVALGNRR